jgi:Glycosyltransferase Family 4
LGGAERWYRNLALRLVERGNEVTYLTMRRWDAGTEPDLPDVRVVAVAPRIRRILPPLAFGLGVFRHLIRKGRGYDVVHTASFGRQRIHLTKNRCR